MSIEEKQKLAEFLHKRVTEAIKLRFDNNDLSMDSGPIEVLAEIHHVRKRLDRIEGLLLEVSRVRGKLLIAHNAAKSIAEDAWDEASRGSRKSSAVWGSDYRGKEERYADIKLETMGPLREARIAEEMFTLSDDATRTIRIAYNGLDNTRQDLLAWLRTFKIESPVER